MTLWREKETWIFDLDNTLYPADCDLFALIDVRMKAFIADYLDLHPEEAFKVQKQYFHEYGTTLRGLMQHHGMEPQAFLDYVHDIDLAPIQANPKLDRLLAGLEGQKLIFTNGSSGHAERVMDKLGVSHHFDAVFDIVAADYTPKPHPEVYDKLVGRHGIDPGKTVMIEDMARNLEPAAALGMTTVWIRTNSDFAHLGADGDYIDHQADDLVDWLGSLTD